ncbi:MAG: lactate utilization protein [Clostridium sp.]|nr:lactate utilization protein [Clostridium sp.]
MEPKKICYENLAKTIINKLEVRGMAGYYCHSKEEALAQVLELMKKGSSVTWGGSETLKEIGIFEAIRNGDYELYDRATAKTLEENRAFFGKAVTADYFLMSTNAITHDGQLVNIDGNGNRVACLICGPQNVIVIAGMNKVVKDVEAGIQRTHDVAAPPNAIRLDKDTGCREYGKCLDCLKDDCICCHTVVTRKSREKNRIKVILVGEELGY